MPFELERENLGKFLYTLRDWVRAEMDLSLYRNRILATNAEAQMKMEQVAEERLRKVREAIEENL